MSRAMLAMLTLPILGLPFAAGAQTPGHRGDTGEAITDSSPRVSICPTAACYPGLVGLLAISSQAQVAGKSNWVLSSSLYSANQGPGDSDVAAYFGAAQGAAAAVMWSLNTNVVRGSSQTTLGNGGTVLVPGGQVPLASSTIGYELDFSNWDQDATGIGTGFTVGQYIHNQSYFTSQDAIYLDANPLSGPVNGNTTNFAWKYGLSMYGRKLNKAADLYLNTGAGYALQIQGSHQIGLDTTGDTTIAQAINVHSGQSICLKGETVQDCIAYNAATGNLTIANNSGAQNVVIQDTGNVVVAGTLTAAGNRDLQLSGTGTTRGGGQVMIPFPKRPDGTPYFTQPPSAVVSGVAMPLADAVQLVSTTTTSATIQFYVPGTASAVASGQTLGYAIHLSGH